MCSRRLYGDSIAMAFRPKSDAETIFPKYFECLSRCVEEAHATYLDRHGSGLAGLEVATKRSMMRDIIVKNLRDLADGGDEKNGMHFFQRGCLSYIGVENDWVIRVKHVDHKYKVGVSPTADSRSFNRNEVPDDVSSEFGGREPTALYLGWRINENAPMAPEVALVCNNSAGEVAWLLPIVGDGLPPELMLPLPETGPKTGTKVKIKKTIKVANSNG